MVRPTCSSAQHGPGTAGPSRPQWTGSVNDPAKIQAKPRNKYDKYKVLTHDLVLGIMNYRMTASMKAEPDAQKLALAVTKLAKSLDRSDSDTKS